MDVNRIVYEDEYLIVYNKPAGLAVQTKRVTESDLESEIKSFLYADGGEPYLGLVHRLDQPVEGLVLFAKTPDAAAYLSEKISSDEVEKRYAAVVEGVPGMPEGRVVDYISWDGRTNLATVSDKNTKGAKKAALFYNNLETASVEGRDLSLLDIRLFTGRHHQIRVQLSHMGCPIIGDRKYNNISPAPDKASFPALSAYALSFPHPKTGKPVEVRVKPANPLFDLFHYFNNF